MAHKVHSSKKQTNWSSTTQRTTRYPDRSQHEDKAELKTENRTDNNGLRARVLTKYFYV